MNLELQYIGHNYNMRMPEHLMPQHVREFRRCIREQEEEELERNYLTSYVEFVLKSQVGPLSPLQRTGDRIWVSYQPSLKMQFARQWVKAA